MRSPTGSEVGVEDGECALASGADSGCALIGGWLGGVAGGAGLACCCGGAGVRTGTASAGAVPGGSKATGFCAVWQEEADRASKAKMAIRVWSFATRIFLYEIRIAPWLRPGEFYQKSYPAVAPGSTSKGDRRGYFRHLTSWLPQPLVRRKKLGNVWANLSALLAPCGERLVRRASSPDAKSGSTS